MTGQRLVLALVALFVGVLILRAPTMGVGSRAERMGAAREESAYVLGAAPVRFALPSGARALRLLINFDRRERPGPTAEVFEARVRVSPDGRDETFALLARDDDGAAAGSFYLDSARRPARTATLGLERDRDDEGVLEISLLTPGGATGVGRVLALQKRALGTAEPAWASLPASGAARRRRIYFAPRAGDSGTSSTSSTSVSASGGGVWLAPARASAWTLTGPATVSLGVAEGSLRGTASLLTVTGAVTERALALDPGTTASVALGAGLTTMRLRSSVAARVVLTGATPAAADGVLTRAVPLDGGRFELRAHPTIIETTRTAPGTPGGKGNVTFDVAGRGDQPLRIDVRALPRDGDDATPLDVSWRLHGRAGQVLAQGARALPVRAAPEDAVVGSEAWLGEPASFFVWPSADATTLEIATGRAAEIAAASPAWGDASGDDAGAGAGALAAVRLRHGAPPRRRAFFGVAPAERAALLAAGRVDRLALAPRLERVPAPVHVAAQSLTPVGQVPRTELLVPDSSGTRLPTQVWALAAGRDARLVSEGGGATVLYTADAVDVGGSLVITCDGRVVSAGRLLAARGQVAFAAPAGTHTLRVEAPPSARLFLNRPLSGAPIFRHVSLYALASAGPTHVRVDKGFEGYVVGVILYGRGGAGRSISFDVDQGGDVGARRGRASSDRTTLRRALSIATSPVRAPVLLNTDVTPTWVSQPLFVRLGDDLAPGPHDLAIRVVGARGPTFARVFGHVDERSAQTRALGPLAWDLGT